MRIARFVHEGQPSWGFVQDGQITAVEDFAGPSGPMLTDSVPLAGVSWLAPAMPTKVVAVGLNYRDHAEELGMPIPEEPLLFLKPPSAVIGPASSIVMPARSNQVDYEAELAVVIGKRSRDVPAARAAEHILGYTCGNDVTARDLQKLDGQWTRAKSFDTFCPIGPWIETDLDTGALEVQALVNGEIRQSSTTEQMIFAVPELIEFISSVMTLEAGDVILTGTPPGVGPLAAGDTVTIRVSGIGELTNPVR